MKTEQFDFIEGRFQAEKGMELANGAARVQRWKERAEVWLRGKASGSDFTADDLTRDIGLPDETRNNVIGAWFNAQHQKHKIIWTGRMTVSTRVSRHTGLHRIWMKA